MYFDPLYIIFALPGLLLGLGAQLFLWYAYGRYSKVRAGSGLTGMQAAELLNTNENFGVSFMTTPGKLNDHFNPSSHTVNLSSDNAVNSSIANIAVVAHEFGHVQQKTQASALFAFRNFLVPTVNIGSTVGYLFILIGIGISATGLAWLGVALFSLTTVFSLLTLPIELDASRRGLNLIKEHNLIAAEQMGGARTVLTAAALTYFAGLVASLGQLLYFVMMVQGRSKD